VGQVSAYPAPLVWLGALAAVGAVAGLVFALLPNDEGGISTPTSNKPVQRIRGERQVPLTAASRAQINTLLDRFIPAAVARRDPAAAYDLVTPSMRAQTTCADWASGSVPAPTYDPSGIEFHGWRAVLSYPNQASVELIADQVALARRRDLRAGVVRDLLRNQDHGEDGDDVLQLPPLPRRRDPERPTGYGS
jgi:hypothetical protein